MPTTIDYERHAHEVGEDRFRCSGIRYQVDTDGSVVDHHWHPLGSPMDSLAAAQALCECHHRAHDSMDAYEIVKFAWAVESWDDDEYGGVQDVEMVDDERFYCNGDPTEGGGIDWEVESWDAEVSP